ncbi:MAG: SMC-Scp complex subunit ScpB [Verrucomicrobiota bacterium]
MELRKIVEALLFASHEPVTAKELMGVIRTGVREAGREERAARQEGEAGEDGLLKESDLMGGEDSDESGGIREELGPVSEKAVTEALEALAEYYRDGDSAITVVEGPEGWKHYTRPEMAPWVRHLFPGQKAERLSAPALETLAIIAYRQPITKANIEAVRGVSVDGVLQKVLDRGLVRIGGKAELPGRPLLYETTDIFLEHFGIKSLEDLPNSAELKRVELPTAEAGEASEDGSTDGEQQMTFGEAKGEESGVGDAAVAKAVEES